MTPGCQKNSETIDNLIIGKWDWVESATLEFTNGGLIRSYQNDTLLSSTDYSIETYSTEPGKYELLIDPDLKRQIHLVEDSLFLNSAFVDGPISSYVRIE